MRKFKHKITRDEVRTYSEDYYISAETACIPKRFIENSNDWEEIVEKESLLTTEDGVEIYGSEALHIVSKCFTLGIGLNFTKDDYKDSSYLFFAKKENAERYIDLNSPKYSIKDIVPMINIWAMSDINENQLLNFLAKNENNNV